MNHNELSKRPENLPINIEEIKRDFFDLHVALKEAKKEVKDLELEEKFLERRLEAARQKAANLTQKEQVMRYDLAKASGDKYAEAFEEVYRRLDTERPDLFGKETDE